MAQRLRRSASITRGSNIHYCDCDPCLNKMRKKDRTPSPINRPQSASASSRPTSPKKCSKNHVSHSVLMPTVASALKQTTRQHLPLPKTPLNSTNLNHKDLASDNSALVEVTVRTHTSKKPTNHKRDQQHQQPWRKLLRPKENAGKKGSSFSDFDPLRTLHFLAKELQSKLKQNGLGDPHMQKIVSSMQQALTHIPPEVSSTIQLPRLDNALLKQSTNEIKRSNNTRNLMLHNEMETAVSKILEIGQKACNSEDLGYPMENEAFLPNDLEFPERLIPTVTIKPSQAHKMCQTSNGILVESHIFRKQLASSTKKLEKSCKDMEFSCKQLKTEKEEIELLLSAEKDTVKFLRKQIQELEAEKTDLTNYTIKQLRQEKKNLTAQVQKLQTQLESDETLPFQELRSLVQQLQLEKTNVEQENMTLRHQLTISSMEKEKFRAILNVRDHQIDEIRTEMMQLQEVVNEQLLELQKSPYVSSPSSHSTIVDKFVGVPWEQMPSNTRMDKEIGDILSALPNNSDGMPLQKIFENDIQTMHLFREVPSGDCTSVSNLESLNTKVTKNDSDTSSAMQMKIISLKDIEM